MKYAIYIRVSTRKQGSSGLGLEAQRKMCEDFIVANGGEKAEEFCDVESGTHRDRKGLAAAIAYCKTNGCALVIAKLDRLARDVEFCFKVVNTGIEIHFVDMPQMNTLLLGVFAAVAQYERELTSDRTKKALAAKKERGETTGGASDKWRETFDAKPLERRKEESAKRGATKNARYVDSRDVQTMLKIFKRLFPTACGGENPQLWSWNEINTKNGMAIRIAEMMCDFKGMADHTLFAKWDFDGMDNRAKQVKIASYIHTIREAIMLNK